MAASERLGPDLDPEYVKETPSEMHTCAVEHSKENEGGVYRCSPLPFHRPEDKARVYR